MVVVERRLLYQTARSDQFTLRLSSHYPQSFSLKILTNCQGKTASVVTEIAYKMLC